jgi:predicted nucleic acid-binding Zn ribbon protein
MPVYEYEILGPDGAARGIYEVEQKLSEPAFVRHPVTGEPLRRILSRTFALGSSDKAAGGCASGACDTGAGHDLGGGGCSSGTCGWG